MKKLYCILIALLIVSSASSQNQQPCSSCLPEGITFTTQAQIDGFQVYYPGCTEIEGDVTIFGDDITNLNGLNVLTSIGSSLNIGEYVGDNPNLTTLAGLEGLTSISGNLWICGNLALTSLKGLENLTFIGGDLNIGDGGDMELIENPSLTSLEGLEGLTSIGGDLGIIGNYALTSLTALEGVTSIRGGLCICCNYDLTSLTGLESIDAGSISDLYIHDNTSLSTCAVQSVCDYLASPNGTIEIHDNATGCDNQEEVEAACEATFVEDLTTEASFSIYSNPALIQITIETSTPTQKNTLLTIYNLNGQQLIERQITEPTTVIDVGTLPGGVYVVRLLWEKGFQVGKFVKQ